MPFFPAISTLARGSFVGLRRIVLGLLVGACAIGGATSNRAIAQAPAASLSDVEIQPEITMMAGLQMPIVIGKVGDAGLPNGTKFIVKGLPKTITAFPAALRAEKRELRLPMTAANPKTAGSFEVEFILTRGKERVERKSTITLVPFDTEGALKTCLMIRAMPGQPSKVQLARSEGYRVELVNLNAQPIPIPRNPDATSAVPYDAGGVYRWIERLDGDGTVRIPSTVRFVQTDKFYGPGPFPLDKDAQLAPGTLSIVMFSSQVVGAQPLGKYRILFEYRTPADRNRKPGKIPESPHCVSIPFEVVRP